VTAKFGTKVGSILLGTAFSLATVVGCNTEEAAPEGPGPSVPKAGAPGPAGPAGAPGKPDAGKAAPAMPPKDEPKP
jgi:hypothetical protein